MHADKGAIAAATQWAATEPAEYHKEALQTLQVAYLSASPMLQSSSAAPNEPKVYTHFQLQRARDLLSGEGGRRRRAPLAMKPTPQEELILRELSEYCLKSLLPLAAAPQTRTIVDQRSTRRASYQAPVQQTQPHSPPQLHSHKPEHNHLLQHLATQRAQADLEHNLRRLRLSAEVTTPNAAYSSAATATRHAQEQELQLQQGAAGLHAQSQAFFPGEASRERVLLAAARMPPGSVADIDYSRYLGGTAAPVTTRQLAFYLDLMPSLLQLFIEYTPSELQFAQQRGLHLVRHSHAKTRMDLPPTSDTAAAFLTGVKCNTHAEKELGGPASVMKMEQFVAQAVFQGQGGEPRLPEAGFRALLLDLDICPRLVQAVDITVVMLMTKLGCPPALEHPRLATQAAAGSHPGRARRPRTAGSQQHSAAQHGTNRATVVSTADISARSRSLAQGAVPFEVVASTDDSARAKRKAKRSKLLSLGDGEIMMSSDALNEQGSLSLSFTEFVDVLGRCALLHATKGGSSAAPAALAWGGGSHSDSCVAMEEFFLNELQLHDFDIWSAKVPSAPWFTFFEQVNQKLRKAAAAKESAAGFASKQFRFTSSTDELLRSTSIRYCLHAMMQRYSSVSSCMLPGGVVAFLSNQHSPTIGAPRPEPALTLEGFLELLTIELLPPLLSPLPQRAAHSLREAAASSATLAFRACATNVVLLRKSASLDRYQVVSAKFSSEVDPDDDPLKCAVQRAAVQQHKWRDLFARTALALVAARESLQATNGEGRPRGSIAIAFDAQRQLDAVASVLALIGISRDMPRQAVRAWVAAHSTKRSSSPAGSDDRGMSSASKRSPLLSTRPTTAPSRSPGQRAARTVRASSFNSSGDLEQASWVGMKALKQLGERRRQSSGGTMQGRAKRRNRKGGGGSGRAVSPHSEHKSRVRGTLKHAHQTEAMPTQYLPK